MTRRWFAVNMGERGRFLRTPSNQQLNFDLGTGITALILYNLPYQFAGVRILATIVFVLNVVLFFTFVAV